MSMKEQMLEAEVQVLKDDRKRWRDYVQQLEGQVSWYQAELTTANFFTVALLRSVGGEVRISDKLLQSLDKAFGVEVLEDALNGCKIVRAVRKEIEDGGT